MRSQVNAQLTMLSTRNDEKDQYVEEIETLKQDILGLEGELSTERDRRSANMARSDEVRQLQEVFERFR